MRFIVLLLIFISIFSCSTLQSRYTSFHPGELWQDNHKVHINAHGGGILYHQGTWYWYGEHKVAGELGNSAQVGVHVYSSMDLYNWTDEGIALHVVTDDSTHDIAKGCILERPKVIYNNSTGKFVMWFHLELLGRGYDTARSGVAVADSPTGPFTYLHSLRPNAGYWPRNVLPLHKRPVADSVQAAYCGGLGCLPNHPDSLNLLGRDFKRGQMARDMTLFVDADSKAYHIYASEENSTLQISLLSDDYTTFAGEYSREFVNRYMEAPSIFRTSNGKYYLIASGCTGWAPNAARSAVADNIWGPWTELGNPCVGPDAETTFHSQSTYILPVSGKDDAFIFMADRWQPKNAIDGRYIWLPIQFENGKLRIEWLDSWSWEEMY